MLFVRYRYRFPFGQSTQVEGIYSPWKVSTRRKSLMETGMFDGVYKIWLWMGTNRTRSKEMSSWCLGWAGAMVVVVLPTQLTSSEFLDSMPSNFYSNLIVIYCVLAANRNEWISDCKTFSLRGFSRNLYS